MTNDEKIKNFVDGLSDDDKALKRYLQWYYLEKGYKKTRMTDIEIGLLRLSRAEERRVNRRDLEWQRQSEGNYNGYLKLLRIMTNNK